MYVNPFWMGVLATIAVEFIGILILAIRTNTRKHGGEETHDRERQEDFSEYDG